MFPTDCPVPTVVECPVSAALYHHATVYAGNAVIGLCGSGDEQQHIYTAAQTECRLMVSEGQLGAAPGGRGNP